EKATFPRDKLCGEFVSPESARILERLGMLEELSRMSARASSVLLSDAEGRSVLVPLTEPGGGAGEALGIPRMEMDALLLERAARERLRPRQPPPRPAAFQGFRADAEGDLLREPPGARAARRCAARLGLVRRGLARLSCRGARARGRALPRRRGGYDRSVRRGRNVDGLPFGGHRVGRDRQGPRRDGVAPRASGGERSFGLRPALEPGVRDADPDLPRDRTHCRPSGAPDGGARDPSSGPLRRSPARTRNARGCGTHAEASRRSLNISVIVR